MGSASEDFRAFIDLIKTIPWTLIEGFHPLSSAQAMNDSWPTNDWGHSAQLAEIGKFLILFGADQGRPLYDLSEILNPFKKFWRSADKEAPYAGEESKAVFLLRFAYQQLPFLISRQRALRSFEMAHSLFGSQWKVGDSLFCPGSEFKKYSGFSLDRFLHSASCLYKLFCKKSTFGRQELVSGMLADRCEDIYPTLDYLSSDRAKFRGEYEKNKAKNPWETPYEFNPLLWYPIIRANDQLVCPFPELIVHASTRGLYFYLNDRGKQRFSEKFGPCFEQYVGKLLLDYIPDAQHFTEEQERAAGWHGKTTDFSIVVGDKALLFECKTSAIFFRAKVRATTEQVTEDLRKTLANPEDESGLFQLIEKVKAIENRQLPSKLQEAYSGVNEVFPIILLYDQIQFANTDLTLRGILDKQVSKSGQKPIAFQIWHLGELLNLLELVPKGRFVETVQQKFRNSNRQKDLNTLLYELTGKRFLRPPLFIPGEGSLALELMKSIADRGPDEQEGAHGCGSGEVH